MDRSGSNPLVTSIVPVPASSYSYTHMYTSISIHICIYITKGKTWYIEYKPTIPRKHWCNSINPILRSFSFTLIQYGPIDVSSILRSSRSMRKIWLGWSAVAAGDIQIWYGEKRRRTSKKKEEIITTNTRLQVQMLCILNERFLKWFIILTFSSDNGGPVVVGTGTTIIIVMMIVDQWILYITCFFFYSIFLLCVRLDANAVVLFWKLQVSVCCGEPWGDQSWGVRAVRVGFLF